MAEEHDVAVGPTEPASAPIGTVGTDEGRVLPEPASAPIGTAGEGEDNDDDMPPLNNIRAPVLPSIDSAPVTCDPSVHEPPDYAGQITLFVVIPVA